jgi:hypothetical protein
MLDLRRARTLAVGAFKRDCPLCGFMSIGDRFPESLYLNPAVVEPIGAPDTMEAPSEMLKDVLAQPVPLPCP